MFQDLLHWTRSLDILLFPSTNRFPESPTWVPDWRSAETHWVKMRYATGYRWARSEPTSYFQGATPDSKPLYSFQRDGIMMVRGYFVSRVDKIMVFQSRSFECSTLSEQQDHVQQLGDLVVGLSARQTTEMYESMRHATQVPVSAGEDVAFYIDSIVSEEFSIALTTTDDYETPHQKAKAALDSMQSRHSVPGTRYVSETWSVWDQHQKFMETIAGVGSLIRCSGRYSGFGIAPDRAMEGDFVTLICGVSMPMILRPIQQGKQFVLVGPALLGGLMNGEHWTKETTEALQDLQIM